MSASHRAISGLQRKIVVKPLVTRRVRGAGGVGQIA